MDIPIDLSTTILETERLFLRPWQENDLNDFFEYASVPGLGEMAGWPHHKSREESAKILNDFITEKNVWAVVLKENKKVIGSVGLHPSWANSDRTYGMLRQKEIGYVLSRKYWGKGLMPEAVREVIRFCFETLKLEAVTVGHFESNHQSQRVIEKCGFSFAENGQFDAKQLHRTFEEKRYILLSDPK